MIIFYFYCRKRAARCDRILRQNEERQKLMDAAKRFLELLREMDVNKDCEIELHEFKNAFDKVFFVRLQKLQNEHASI